jgi:hypothetical protein
LILNTLQKVFSSEKSAGGPRHGFIDGVAGRIFGRGWGKRAEKIDFPACLVGGEGKKIGLFGEWSRSPETLLNDSRGGSVETGTNTASSYETPLFLAHHRAGDASDIRLRQAVSAGRWKNRRA